MFFELAAGVGMPMITLFRPVPTAVAWGVSSAAGWKAAGRPLAAHDARLAAVNALVVAAVAAHLAAWPRRRTTIGLPALTSCEGMGADLMPAYNSLLYVGGVSAVLALLLENRSAPPWSAALAPVAVPVLVLAQRADFALRAQAAAVSPSWWNHRLASGQGGTTPPS